jgi:hypothetical protein
MWDMNGEDQYKKINRKVHNIIAKELGWVDLEDMLLKKEDIEGTPLEKAINMLCKSYRVSKIFKK